MAVFKCKMCGGRLDVDEHSRIVECEYCGTRQTLPKLENEKTSGLFDRAGDLRRQNEFDKAEALYEQILEIDNSDAEVYWSLVLCKYGIEYVEEPDSGKRIPTVHRAQFTSIFADENFKKAIEYADDEQKKLYNEEAEKIEQIQKEIIEISSKEDPFDVFICYKESDENGNRTEDSVIAYDLYQNLINKGYKVFFSRVTLESKLGAAYEPYIFSALNSSKVMIVIGTKPEYFEAVWVKNEWSRFLKMMRVDSSKTLIPAYKNMSPYNLPKEFSYLQAQDMSKLGFLQDITAGIDKILADNNGAEQANTSKKNVIETIKNLPKKTKIISSAVAAVLVVAIVAGAVVLPRFGHGGNKSDQTKAAQKLDENTVNAITNAYTKQLEDVAEFDKVSEYSIYDIDKNGIPELIYHVGTPGGGGGYFRFYTYTDKLTSINSISAGHSSLALPLSGDGLIVLYGHMGYCSVMQITYNSETGFTQKDLVSEIEIPADREYVSYYEAYADCYLYTLSEIDKNSIKNWVNLGYDKYLDSIGVSPKKIDYYSADEEDTNSSSDVEDTYSSDNAADPTDSDWESLQSDLHVIVNDAFNCETATAEDALRAMYNVCSGFRIYSTVFDDVESFYTTDKNYKGDPEKKFSSIRSFGYRKYSVKNVNWILENAMNVKPETVSELKVNDKIAAYEKDGYYYTNISEKDNGYPLEFSINIDQKEQIKDNMFNVTASGAYNGIYNTFTATVAIKDVDGKHFWSIYKWNREREEVDNDPVVQNDSNYYDNGDTYGNADQNTGISGIAIDPNHFALAPR